jgi:hypothetical protein
MTPKDFLRAFLVVLPFTAAIACGGGGSTATGGQATTASSSSSTSAGTAGTATTSSSTSGTTTSSSTSGTTTSSSTSGTTTSSSSSSTSSGATGACQDAADMAVNMTTVGNDASGCVTSSCIPDYLSQNWTGLATCVATCLQNMDHTSTACSACWGTVVSCGAQHCASQCAGGQSTACDMCTDMYCTPAFDACSGE